MLTKTEVPDFYLSNVWRLLFEATREDQGWVPFHDPAQFRRIEQMAADEGRSLQADLDSAQAAVDARQSREQWKVSMGSAKSVTPVTP